MNRPAPISVFSDQRRTKSTIWSRTSCGTQTPVKAPQDFFLKRHARPATRPGPHPWFAPSSPRTQSVSASPPPGGGDVPGAGRRQRRSRRTLSASDRTPLASDPALHTDPRPEPYPKGAASEQQLSLQQCSVCALSSYVCSAILTDKRSFHFQLRRDRYSTVWCRCPYVRAWGSRHSRRPAPVLACRYTPGRSSVCHSER